MSVVHNDQRYRNMAIGSRALHVGAAVVGRRDAPHWDLIRPRGVVGITVTGVPGDYPNGVAG